MSDGLSRPALSFSQRLRQWMPDRQERRVIGLLWLGLVLLSLLGEDGRQWLRYEREAVLQGEYWRLFTAHLVHLNTWHMLLNAGGVALIAALFKGDYSWRGWLLIALFGALAIDLAFVCWEPHILWYVGLSGVLHGALAAGAVSWWQYQPKRLSLALTAILVGKLAWEYQHGGLLLMGDLPVVVEAHRYGALGGLAAGLILWLHAHRQVAVKSRI
ncbi:rhombosortase [Peristeroidobacter agariperforans]|uniref:rhombosortase n=1 Tax=Peristeroidobacter agariperforans TaxID=268404 RepID=UPI00101CD9B3|nr:rhombosortase [Peristeroidobacter agariperforans]